MEITALIAVAIKARELAYAPFSGLKIGAAVLADDDRIYAGCNVENSSFGLSLCAERVAIFKCISEGSSNIKALAVVGDDDNLYVPCGACLQVLAEFASDAQIIVANLRGKKRLSSLSELLPEKFRIYPASG